MYTDKQKQIDTYNNAIELFKILIKEYDPSLKAYAHCDWTKKNCPSWLRSGKYGYNWSWFKNELMKKPKKKVIEYKQLENGDYNKKAKVISNTLNVRSSRPDPDGNMGEFSFKLQKGEIIEIGYVLNGWASIWHEGDFGYINTSNKYIELL
jgi:hypothetical protein